MGLTTAAALAVAAGISAVAGTTATVLTNHKNKKENQKSRDFAASQQEDAQIHDLAMQQQQFDYQTQLNQQSIEAQQQYYDKNLSYQAQVSQLKAAGLNPYLALQGGSAGGGVSTPSGSVSAPSSGAVNASSPIPMESPDIAHAVSSLVSSFSTADLQKNESDAVEMDNAFRWTNNLLDQRQKIVDLVKSGQDVERNKKLLDELDLDLEYLRGTIGERIRGAKLENDKLTQEIQESITKQRLNKAEAQIKELQLPYVEKEMAESINLKAAQAGYYQVMQYKKKELTDKEFELAALEVGEAYFDAVVKGFDENGTTLSDDQMKDLHNIYVEGLEETVKEIESRVTKNKWSIVTSFLGSMTGSAIMLLPAGRAVKAAAGARKAAKAAKAAASKIPQNSDMFLP